MRPQNENQKNRKKKPARQIGRHQGCNQEQNKNDPVFCAMRCGGQIFTPGYWKMVLPGSRGWWVNSLAPSPA